MHFRFSRLFRDVMGFLLLLVLGAGVGLVCNATRTKPLPFLYSTPKERAANCGC